MESFLKLALVGRNGTSLSERSPKAGNECKKTKIFKTINPRETMRNVDTPFGKVFF